MRENKFLLKGLSCEHDIGKAPRIKDWVYKGEGCPLTWGELCLFKDGYVAVLKVNKRVVYILKFYICKI